MIGDETNELTRDDFANRAFSAQEARRALAAARGNAEALKHCRYRNGFEPSTAEQVLLLAMGAPAWDGAAWTECPVDGIDIGERGRAVVQAAAGVVAEPSRRRMFDPSPEVRARAIAFEAEQAERCASLWKAAIVQAGQDVTPHWGVSQSDRREALLLFEGRRDASGVPGSPDYRPSDAERRAQLCELAGISEASLMRAYRSGGVRDLATDSVGKRRWETRRANAEATAPQPDLFRSAAR